MPVCITGMHRSGTSMVANLLRLCGLYLGEECDLMPATPDNVGGYWENRKFSSLNDEILTQLGGTWDFPPIMSAGWAEEERFNHLRVKAEILLEDFRDHDPWGWKDPRNSLTLAFWTSLTSLTVPFWYGAGRKVKIILCVRNPFEVLQSLRDREYTPNAAGLKLWSIYNQSLLNSTLPEDRLVTHYNGYFHNARAELRRVLNFLEMPVSEELIEHATPAISDKLRRQRFRTERLIEEAVDSDVFNLYRELCKEASCAELVGVD